MEPGATAALLFVTVLVVALGVGLGVLAVVLFLRGRKATQKWNEASEQARNIAERNDLLQREVEQLSRYRGIVDVEAHAATLRAEAEQYAAQVNAEARRVWDTANANSLSLREQAQAEAAAVVAEGRRQAEEVVASVAGAAAEVRRLEQAATGIKNIIAGYGDQYVLPTAGLLDELAEEFGFTEPGETLTKARETTKEMVRRGVAATCDYVEANRRTTAIAFVLDAFNGKVDTVLADIRHDNYGTLAQKVHDAFNVVNYNGTAFRNARITQEYLAARLAELQWGVVVQELKLRQREEQRVLKERIREEERAQREFERAQREALKEEEALRKALEKARREVEKATDEQRSQFQQQLQELTEKLRAAEEKNQRAVSMAQQTKSGHVYVISNIGSFGEEVFKIGMTRRLEPLDRVRELGDASVPFEFDVHALISSNDAPSLENALHKCFVRRQVNKVNPRKEFFRVNLGEIRAEVERLGATASWTLEAECRQYRETQSIERAMAAQSFDERAWEEQQLREHEVSAMTVDDADAAL